VKSPYAEEVKAMRQALRQSQDASAKAEKKRHYVCVLYCHRERKLWSGFRKEILDFKTTYYVRKMEFSPSHYYNYYNIQLTEDVTVAQMFTVEEAVAIVHSSPFEVSIQWRCDNRKRCPECDSLCESKLGEDNDMNYTCLKNPEHKVAPFTLFSQKKETASHGK